MRSPSTGTFGCDPSTHGFEIKEHKLPTSYESNVLVPVDSLKVPGSSAIPRVRFRRHDPVCLTRNVRTFQY